MIDYDEGTWHISFLFRRKGSLVPKAFVYAFPSGVSAWSLCYYFEFYASARSEGGIDALARSQVWPITTATIVMLLSFRTVQALGRFWEATGLLHQMRGEWFDAVSCMMAFSTQAMRNKHEEVLEFRHTLIRLTSLMHGCAMHEIKAIASETFEVIDLDGLDKKTLRHLQTCKDEFQFRRFEVLLHMIHVLITDNHEQEVLKIAPPIMSRVYQELSRGMVNLHNAKKITDTQFPFPYAQVIMLLLLGHSLITPLVVASFIAEKWWALIVTFVACFGMYCINLIATELEMPFGDDDNDLPLNNFQAEMNSSLLMLMHNMADWMPHISEEAVLNFDELHMAVYDVNIDSVTASDPSIEVHISERHSTPESRESIASEDIVAVARGFPGI